MTVITTADAIRLGNLDIVAVYAGTEKVWPPPAVAEWSPADLAGLAVWLDASQLGSGEILSWPNLANPGVPGTIIDASVRPYVLTNALNGRSVVRFTYGQSRLRMMGIGVDKDYTVLCVARMIGTPSGYGRILNTTYPPYNLLFGWWAALEDVAYAGDFFTPNMQHPNTFVWKLYSGDAESSPAYKPRLFSDGAFLSGDKTTGQNYTMTDGWGGRLNLSGYSDGLDETCDCEVAEVLLYNRKLPDADRQTVEAYLREKWMT